MNLRSRQSTNPTEPPEHPLDGYLAFLKEKDLVTDKELAVLSTAVAPLRARFHGLSTVERVRDEFRAEAATVDALRRDERLEWETPTSLPWFDAWKTAELFLVNPTRAEEHVIFFDEASRAARRPFVDPTLDNGELFFWIILRMYRLHAESMPEDAIEVR